MYDGLFAFYDDEIITRCQLLFWSSPCMSALYKSPQTEGFTHSVVKQHLELTWLGKIMAFSMHFALSLLLLALEITFVFCVVTKCFEPDPTKAKFNYVLQSCLCKFSGFISSFFYKIGYILFDKYWIYLHCLLWR